MHVYLCLAIICLKLWCPIAFGKYFALFLNCNYIFLWPIFKVNKNRWATVRLTGTRQSESTEKQTTTLLGLVFSFVDIKKNIDHRQPYPLNKQSVAEILFLYVWPQNFSLSLKKTFFRKKTIYFYPQVFCLTVFYIPMNALEKRVWDHLSKSETVLVLIFNFLSLRK